ncbi:hypothetical protein TrVE_jg9649 [Triparma verrucosa]|uniref:EF-hand domain-containing protein n=1 Tax=Triparma verrucosa TaxID=1606542 RepID=A0A9W7FKP9_9STRA|nr:hypothetical protein TrVE_jg9649 [Triparma verrucosa]
MPPPNKQSFKNDAYVPINEKRHNVANLLTNNRDAMKDVKVVKKKPPSRFVNGVDTVSGKAVGSQAKMGLKALGKSKQSKKVASEKAGEANNSEKGKKERENELQAEASDALKEHAEEMATMTMSKKQLRRKRSENKGKTRAFCWKTVMLPCRFMRCLISSFWMIVTGFSRMWHFGYSWVMWEFFGRVTHQVNREQYLLEKYMDQRGELIVIFKTLKLSDEQRLRWVELWSAIDTDEDNTMDVQEFNLFFDLVGGNVKDLIYTRRLFQVFNRNFNGYVNIRDFLTTTWLYCPYDEGKVAELSFRLISRRGDVFEPDVSIIDLVDIEEFVKARYDPMGRKKETSLKKIAVAIFAFLDVDGSGGVGFDEFVVFSKQNPIFLYYGHWYQQLMRNAIFGEQYWRDETNDRPGIYTRDVMQEAMLRDNITEQEASLGVFGPEIQKKKGFKYKVDFPEAWYKQKEEAFLAKQALKDRQDLANEMAKHTFQRMVKVFSRIVPDAVGLRPAFAIWKDWVEYDKSLHNDGGESYAMAHMSLMDVKDAVRAKSLGLTTKKLEAAKTLKNVNDNIEESVHDQVIREAAMGVITDDDLYHETVSNYQGVLNKSVGVTKSTRIVQSIPYELPLTSPVKPLGSLGGKGKYDLLGDEDEDIQLLQMEYGMNPGPGSPTSPSALDRKRAGMPTEEKKDENMKLGVDEYDDWSDDDLDDLL